MASRVTRSRSREATTPDINDEASSTLCSYFDHEIKQLVTDAANKAEQTQARGQDADTDANLSGLTKADLVEMIKAQKDMLRDTGIHALEKPPGCRLEERNCHAGDDWRPPGPI